MQKGPNRFSESNASQTPVTSQQNQPATPVHRYAELDSLRGLAALTVVLHHFRSMWVWADPAPKWLVLLNPVTAGHEAVLLFFLLSGFVLSVPTLQGKGQPYAVYLVRRILRIYAPYLFALALAVSCAAIWHSPLGHGNWANETWLQPVSARLVLAHVFMIGNYDWAQYNTAFWSLVIEMRISIIFPFLFLLIHRLKPAIALVVATLLTFAGSAIRSNWPRTQPIVDTLMYAGVFVCGIVLATQVERVGAWFHSLGGATRWGIGMASFVLYTFGHHLSLFLRDRVGLDVALTTLGAVGYIVLAINAPWAKQMLHTAWARFLGRISYSCYLVHGTVLFALTHALGDRVSVAGHLALYLSATLLLGYGFCLLVEEPFLIVSRNIGKSTWARAAKANDAPTSGIVQLGLPDGLSHKPTGGSVTPLRFWSKHR